MGANNTTHRDQNTGSADFESCQLTPQEVKVRVYITYRNIKNMHHKIVMQGQSPKDRDICHKSQTPYKTTKQAQVNNVLNSESNAKYPTYQLLKNHGVYYEGDWKNGVQEGRGVTRGSNGTYLQAQFRNGKAEGQGVHIYPDGSYYNGQFKNGHFNGRGKFYYKLNGTTYDGQWVDGKPEGKGKQTFPEIGQYEGYFLKGLKHGKGKMDWKDGREYEGDFFEGYMHGEGVLKKDKGYYKGRFDHNNKVAGLMKTQSGTYEGPFIQGQMWGRGKFVWNNGNAYEGQFKYNKMHGNGVMTLKNSQRYGGVWQNGINRSINE